MTEAADRGPAWRRQDPELVQEWLRQSNLIYGGLIVIGVYMVTPFLTAASLDLPARICVVAFSVAIPLLAAVLMVNRQEAFRRRRSRSAVVSTAQVVAQVAAFLPHRVRGRHRGTARRHSLALRTLTGTASGQQPDPAGTTRTGIPFSTALPDSSS